MRVFGYPLNSCGKSKKADAVMKFCSITLGCKVNQYETQGVESILISRGHIRTRLDEDCDVCIINTCAVTAESARKSRQAVRRAKKLNPGVIVAVCGCFSQIDPQTVAALGVDLVGGVGDRRGFALEIEALVSQGSGVFSGQKDIWQADIRQADIRQEDSCHSLVFEELPPGGVAGRTRALLKIQDGCDNRCSYCVIPHARGSARSLPVERAAAQAELLDGLGFREIVVTGIEISSYGKDLAGNPALPDVIRAISAAAPRARLRLGSLDPGAVSEELCEKLIAIPNVCDHFHLSQQSGCDETLLRMGRKYDANTARQAILSLRRRFPDCGITADIIVGFPGETDREFGQTLEFIKTAMFSGMHVFPYSQRPGTKAACLPDQVAKDVKRERARIAAQLAGETARAFRTNQIGKTVEVLFESKRNGFWTGHSRNYFEVAVRRGGEKNSIQNVRLTSTEDDLVWGEII